jgi:ABC-2 type transport system ATP-binding protein
MTAIEVRELRKTYPGGVEAVKGLDFDVHAGEVFGLLGPNGAGKSTTVGMLTTTVAPTGGSARLAGFDVTEQPIAARRVSSVVFQESVLDGGLTGRENLQLHARLWGVQPAVEAQRVAQLVDALGLTELVDRRVDSYSGGQRRRLEIARALMSRPQVLFLDEPTVGLDPRIRHELLDLVASLRAREGVTILLTTHYLDEALRLTDRVAIVHRGEIVALDRPDALLTSLGEQVLQFRVGGSARAAAQALAASGIAASDAFAVGATITLPLHGHTAAQALQAAEAAGVRATEVQVRAPTLDDVYIRLTGAPFGESE